MSYNLRYYGPAADGLNCIAIFTQTKKIPKKIHNRSICRLVENTGIILI